MPNDQQKTLLGLKVELNADVPVGQIRIHPQTAYQLEYTLGNFAVFSPPKLESE